MEHTNQTTHSLNFRIENIFLLRNWYKLLLTCFSLKMYLRSRSMARVYRPPYIVKAKVWSRSFDANKHEKTRFCLNVVYKTFRSEQFNLLACGSARELIGNMRRMSSTLVFFSAWIFTIIYKYLILEEEQTGNKLIQARVVSLLSWYQNRTYLCVFCHYVKSYTYFTMNYISLSHMMILLPFGVFVGATAIKFMPMWLYSQLRNVN